MLVLRNGASPPTPLATSVSDKPRLYWMRSPTESSRKLGASAESTERSAFQQQTAPRAPAAFVRDDVDHAADRIGPIKRGARTAHYFDPIRVGEQQVFDQPRGVPLRGGGIPQPQTVDQYGGVLDPKPADLDRGVAPWSAELLHSHARRQRHDIR